MNDNTAKVRAGYDILADEYVAHVFEELQHKPLDRALLDRFAKEVQGPVCDMGCGPGHIARYLHGQGASVSGIDLSPEMVERARRLNPDVSFSAGDMLALNVPDDTFAGIAAFYSIIHIQRADVVRALRELRRVLKPRGLLLMSFHVGSEILHRDELWGKKIDVDFVFFEPLEMSGYLTEAGFTLVETVQRDPYPDVEFQSRRAYIFARK
jgi:ubiquinone/menaquinone biosynthesis C-methylase UbiE